MIQPLLALMLMGAAVGFSPSFPEPWTGPVAVVIYLALGWMITRRSVDAAERAADAGEPWRGPSHGLLHLAAWGAVLFGSSWLGFVWKITDGISGLAHALAFSPYVAHRVIRCLAQWPLEARDARRSWTRREYVVFHVRVLLLVVIPILIAQTLLDVLQSAPGIEIWINAYGELVIPIAAAAVLTLVFTCAPLLVRFILGARPLEPGPLRTRLEAYGKRTGFRPNDILVWNTGNTVTNALYIGIVPRIRYVVVTDALLSKLEPEQVEAVYAHEAGHGMRRHTLLFMLLALGLVFGANAVMGLVQRWLPGLIASWSPDMQGVAMWTAVIGVYIVLLGLFFLVGMGWLSRRFETEADLHAVRTLEDTGPFVRALEAVGLHMGALKPDRGGMRHFGIGTRIGLVNRYTCEPEYRAAFDRVLRRCRWGVVAVLVASLLPVMAAAPRALVVGQVEYVRFTGYDQEATGDRAAAAASFEIASMAARAAARDHPEFSDELRRAEIACMAALADIHLKEGRYSEAQRVLDSMSTRVFERDVLGWFNTRNLRVILDASQGNDDLELTRTLIEDFDAFTAGMRWNASVDQTYTDLFLVLRAGGADDPAPGRKSGYSPAAQLLLEFDEDLVDAAKKDLDENRYRRRLLERAAPGLPARLK